MLSTETVIGMEGVIRPEKEMRTHEKYHSSQETEKSCCREKSVHTNSTVNFFRNCLAKRSSKKTKSATDTQPLARDTQLLLSTVVSRNLPHYMAPFRQWKKPQNSLHFLLFLGKTFFQSGESLCATQRKEESNGISSERRTKE